MGVEQAGEIPFQESPSVLAFFGSSKSVEGRGICSDYGLTEFAKVQKKENLTVITILRGWKGPFREGMRRSYQVAHG